MKLISSLASKEIAFFFKIIYDFHELFHPFYHIISFKFSHDDLVIGLPF